MIVTLPSDVAAYTIWADACYAGTGSCSFDPVDGFPDTDVIYTWGGQGDSSNNVRTIYFEDGTPGGSYEVFAPISAPFTVTSFVLALDTTETIGMEYSEDAIGLPLTPGMPAYAKGAAAIWESLNPSSMEYQSGEQLFTLEIARAATPDSWAHVFDTLSGLQDNTRRLISGATDRLFVTFAGDPESPTSASMTQFTGSQTLIPDGGSLTINPGDSLRITFFRSDIEDMSPADPHFVFGPLSFIFDTPETEFWTNFNRTTEQAE